MPAAAGAQEPYYLALGDSLARGIQPDATGAYVPTNQGYADDLYAFYHRRFPSLRLANLSCSSETTASMIAGPPLSPCSYPAGSQLSQAVQFATTHAVVLITIDIGADDLLQCFHLATVTVDSTCLAGVASTVPSHVVSILAALRAAAPNALIVGMNYYDPFLGAAILGPTGRTLAVTSLPIIKNFNTALGLVYQAMAVPVADVASTFHVNDPGGVTPLNIAIAWLWTWMGAAPPRGPDVHPNALGYLAIASAFAKAVTPAAGF